MGGEWVSGGAGRGLHRCRWRLGGCQSCCGGGTLRVCVRALGHWVSSWVWGGGHWVSSRVGWGTGEQLGVDLVVDLGGRWGGGHV